jgi:menaquinone-dependent protoporphyrinogen oxidase
METKYLIAYTSNAGSTQEVAEAVAGAIAEAMAEAMAFEVGKSGPAVDVRRLEDVDELSSYAGVVIGGPMIMGWHRKAVKFIKKHQKALSQIPVAYFITAMSLTKTGDTQIDDVPVLVDPNLPKEPKNPGRLSLAEKYATARHYVGPVLRAEPHVRPVSVAIFGGKLEYFRLKLLQLLFVMLIIRAQPGDRRNWPAIQKWAAGLPQLFSSNLVRISPKE